MGSEASLWCITASLPYYYYYFVKKYIYNKGLAGSICDAKSDAKVMQAASIDFTGVTEDCLFNPSKPLCISA